MKKKNRNQIKKVKRNQRTKLKKKLGRVKLNSKLVIIKKEHQTLTFLLNNPNIVSPIKVDGSGDIARIINQTGVVPSTETTMFGCEIEKSIPNYVRDFADKKGLGEFIRVPIRTKGLTGSGYSFKCHFNVAGLVSWKGGKVLKGYSVFQDEGGETVDRTPLGHTQFTYHSVWITPEGNAVCVSNNYEEREDIEKDFDNILFIPIGIGQIEELGYFPQSTMFDPFWKVKGFWNTFEKKVVPSSYSLIHRIKTIPDISICKSMWKDMVDKCDFHNKSLGSGKTWSEVKRELKLVA